MQPLTQYDLILNFVVGIMMPILILANLKDWGRNSPLNTYLWREEPGLMRVSLVMLGLLTLNSLVQLAGHYGLMSTTVAGYTTPILGIPFLIATIAVLWLAGKAVVQYLRARKSQA